MFGTMGATEILLFLVIGLLLFGVGKLPTVGEGLGKALTGFKKALREHDPPPQTQEPTQTGHDRDRAGTHVRLPPSS